MSALALVVKLLIAGYVPVYDAPACERTDLHGPLQEWQQDWYDRLRSRRDAYNAAAGSGVFTAIEAGPTGWWVDPRARHWGISWTPYWRCSVAPGLERVVPR